MLMLALASIAGGVSAATIMGWFLLMTDPAHKKLTVETAFKLYIYTVIAAGSTAAAFTYIMLSGTWS